MRQLIVKIYKKESTLKGDSILIMDEERNKVSFPITDVNYSKIHNMLNGRLKMYAHATIKNGQIDILMEAPHQLW